MARTKNLNGARGKNSNTNSNAVRGVGAKLSGEWRPQHRKAFFNGGSSLDWMKFKPRMETAFVESECYHYVEVPKVTSSASGASSTGISENRFTDAEPIEVEMVADEIAKQKTRVSNSLV